LESSAGSEFKVASAVAGLGVFFAGGVPSAVTGLEDLAVSGEPLAPLGFWDSRAWGAALVASRLEGLSALGFLFSICGSFMESGSMSYGAMHKLWN
jgi:hypothetical protein